MDKLKKNQTTYSGTNVTSRFSKLKGVNIKHLYAKKYIETFGIDEYRLNKTT